MATRNPHFAKLNPSYLFHEIAKRKLAYLEAHPHAKLISLGIGDTTEPLTPEIVKGLKARADLLGTKEGYTGYGPAQGEENLRKRIVEHFYGDKIQADEIYISDGAKCDIGRIQLLFGPDSTVAVQDPAYPVYVDTSISTGKAKVHFLTCNPENNFFPDLEKAPRTDILFFCSPNNPTGAVATREDLKRLVAFCKKNKTILIFDSAYSPYIQDKDLPKSIYEIEGADEVAIEVSSFSKLAGFTGVRLAWSVVPKKLKFEGGEFIFKDWSRIHSTYFNGPSNIAESGAFSALSSQGLKEVQAQVQFYLENARLIRETLLSLGLKVYGGDNAPYLWVYFKGKNSWDAFEELLNDCQIISTPGVGFGPAGEGFVRFSAFGHRENILECCKRLMKLK